MDKVKFIGNLGQRASAVMMSGDGTRCIVTIEAYGTQAALALAVLQYAGADFQVTIEKIAWTELDDAIKQGAKSQSIRVGRRRSKD